MFYNPYAYELSPLYIAQVALTIWMLVDANRRGVAHHWFWIILVFQPFGAWAYFVCYKIKDFHPGTGWLTGLFHRPASLQELRHLAEKSPTVANRLELGQRLVETAAHVEAVPHLEAVLKREPDHCRALFLLAQAQRGLGHAEQAVPLLQKLIARQPTWSNHEGWRALIEVHQEVGDLPAAVTQARELARVAPCLEHSCLLAEYLVEAGEKVEARKLLERELEEYRYLPGPSRRRHRRWAGKAKQLVRQIT